MKWLPSFVTLFLVFVAGLVLQLAGIVGVINFPWSSGPGKIFDALRLLGMLIMLISPLLIALKFFSRLDKKS